MSTLASRPENSLSHLFREESTRKPWNRLSTSNRKLAGRPLASSVLSASSRRRSLSARDMSGNASSSARCSIAALTENACLICRSAISMTRTPLRSAYSTRPSPCSRRIASLTGVGLTP